MVLLAGAFFPLQAAAAGAGIVAADLGDLFHRLLLHAAVAGAGLAGDLGHPLALNGGGGLHPGDEDAAQRLLLNGGHHLLEHVITLALIFHHGVVLAVCPQADALLEFVHGVDVVHPVFVHHAQHHDALQLAHEGAAQLLLLVIVDRLGLFDQQVGQLLRALAGKLPVGKPQLPVGEEHAAEGRGGLPEALTRHAAFFRHVALHGVLHHRVQHASDGLL